VLIIAIGIRFSNKDFSPAIFFLQSQIKKLKIHIKNLPDMLKEFLPKQIKKAKH
jgi:hypothetical protein